MGMFAVGVVQMEGFWLSACLLISNFFYHQNETADVYDFTDNECAVSLVACNFHGNEGSFIIVGTAKNQVLQYVPLGA
jgi:hypothetical protein